MRIKIYSLIVVLSTLAFFSCDETEEENKYHNWRARNEAFIDSLELASKTDPLLMTLEDEITKKTIYYKVIEPGDQDSKSPVYTSKVNIYYRGMLIDETVFGANPGTKFLTSLYDKGLLVFDKTFTGPDPDPKYDAPKSSLVSNFVSGYVAALQNMHPGDRWEIYIPHQSGYKSQSSGSVRAYSTLIFDLTLVSIEEY